MEGSGGGNEVSRTTHAQRHTHAPRDNGGSKTYGSYLATSAGHERNMLQRKSSRLIVQVVPATAAASVSERQNEG